VTTGLATFALALIGGAATERHGLREQLVAFGHAVVELDPDGALEGLAAGIPPDLVLLELEPVGTVAAVRSVRARSRLPLMVVSSEADVQHKIRVLDAGADDYLARPFPRAELFARIRALVRRAREAVPVEGRPIDVGRLRIDPSGHQVALGGRAIALTRFELRVLVALARNVGRVLSIDALVLATWGDTEVDKSDNLRGLIASIRRKIEPDPARPRWLVNKVGAGYALRDPGASWLEP
jgi:two-component system KDP operon response regulator KdpE